jgi:signal transduction histidine kinase
MSVGKVVTAFETTPARTVITLRRLKIALCASVIVPLLLFFAGAVDERHQLLLAAGNEAKASAAVLREHVLKTLEIDELLIRDVDYRIKGKSWDEIRADATTLSKDIGALHAGLPQVSLMAVTDAEGLIQAGTPPHRVNERMSIAHQELWTAQRDADQGTFFSRPYVGRLTKQPNFGLSRRRSTPDGRFDGTIHVAVPASYFSDFWSEAIAGKGAASIALVRLDGEVLARFPALAAPSSAPAPQHSLTAAGPAVEPQGGTYRTAALDDGEDRIYAYARIGTFPLVIRYGLSTRAALAPWRLHLLVLSSVGTIAAGALALALMAAIRQVHRLNAEQVRRAEIEEAARKGQRVELLGQLSAGTAHDLANILQAMQVGATLILRRAGEPDRVNLLARRLEEDAERGVSLTRRMLDLVRRNHGQADAGPTNVDAPFNPSAAITSVANLLSRILGSAHQLRAEVAAEEPPILIQGNRTDFEVAVMNLAVNARDAMPNGGEVVIQTAAVSIGGTNSVDTDRGMPQAPGLYMQVSVIDTGVGMPADVLARAGERFFTTKPSGQGTGLGLASAREFAECLGGKLSITSKVGEGTTATLWLPAVSPSSASVRPITEAVGDHY